MVLAGKRRRLGAKSSRQKGLRAGGSRAPGPWTGDSFTVSVTWGPQSRREMEFISWAEGTMVGQVGGLRCEDVKWAGSNGPE